MPKTLILSLFIFWVWGCPNQQGCLRCTPGLPGFCELCEGGWSDDEGKCRFLPPEKTIPFCATYSRPGNKDGQPACLSCLPGYGFEKKESRRKCVPCADSRCAECEVRTICTSCYNLRRSYKVSNEESICIDLRTTIPNCDQMKFSEEVGGNECAKCLPGYAVGRKSAKDNQGVCVRTILTNCRTLDSADPSKCGQCEWGFSLTSDGSCKNPKDLENYLELLQFKFLERKIEAEKAQAIREEGYPLDTHFVPTTSSKKNLILGIGIFLMLVSAFGGFYYLRQVQGANPVSASQSDLGLTFD